MVRYFTRGLRFPRLIGKTPDGTKLWGGPYTTLQAVGGLTTLVLAFITRGLWTSGDFFTTYLVIFGVTAAVIYGLKYVKTGSRNPLIMVQGLVSVLLQPQLGRLNGQPVRLRRPRRISSCAVQRRAGRRPDRTLEGSPTEEPGQPQDDGWFFDDWSPRAGDEGSRPAVVPASSPSRRPSVKDQSAPQVLSGVALLLAATDSIHALESAPAKSRGSSSGRRTEQSLR